MLRTIYDYYTYEFSEDNGIIVAYFQTKTNTGYRVYFYPAKDYFDYLIENSLIYNDGYYFGFTKVAPNEDLREPFDTRVMNTIINIIEKFYESETENTILLFHCSSDWGDDKKLKRTKRFDFWFENATSKLLFEKYNEEIVVNEFESGNEIITDKEYLSLILKKSNKNIEFILDEFQQIKNYFASGKE